MNAFIPESPRAVVKVNDDGDVVAVVNNIGPEFKVEVVYTDTSLDALSAGLPFDSRNPRLQTQVLAMKKSK
jgi:hypothetical protein